VAESGSLENYVEPFSQDAEKPSNTYEHWGKFHSSLPQASSDFPPFPRLFHNRFHSRVNTHIRPPQREEPENGLGMPPGRPGVQARVTGCRMRSREDIRYRGSPNSFLMDLQRVSAISV